MNQGDLGRPIRVVIFTGGPTLDRAVVRFAEMLQAHPEIEFVGGFSEAREQGLVAMARDRVRRRGALGVALLTAQAARTVARSLAHPRAERELRRKAARLAELITFTGDIHADAILARVRQLQPDLGLVYGGPILKQRLFTIPQLGTLGIHHGKVPQYRGKKTTFWAMYHGESTAGVTIQRINAGVDAGLIVERGEVPTAGKWLPRVSRELEELGFQLYLEGVIALKRGTAAPVPQSGPKGKLYRDPSAADLLRFWLRQILRRLTSSA
jgi:methionyl-tRNA formyltransferase